MPRREAGRPQLDPEGELLLPCGKCHECISKRAVEWATRAKHEISMHDENCFITLTYSDDNRPQETIKKDFQNFIKKLRKKYKLENKIRYMVSYEYGTKNNHFHMHAILFGFNFKNQELYKIHNGHHLFTSKDLTELWPYGYHTINEANEQTAYYIASYALKGNDKEVINQESGEVDQYRDCMDVSKRPAIGLKYFLKNAEQCVTTGTVPRYYAKKLEDPEWCLSRFPEYESTIKKFPELLDIYETNKWENLKNRSDHEKYASHIINNQKNTCQSTSYRGDSNSSKKNNKRIQEIKLLETILKHNRDNYVTNITRSKHD
jgi:hypothetical protein